MRSVPWTHLVEFFSTRYAHVEIGPDSIVVTGRGNPHAPVVGASTATRARQEPASLIVRRLPNAIEITAMPGDE